MTMINERDAFDPFDDIQCEDFYGDPPEDLDPDEDEDDELWSDDEDWEELERDPYEMGITGDDAIEFFDETGVLTAEAYAFLAEEDASGRFI